MKGLGGDRLLEEAIHFYGWEDHPHSEHPFQPSNLFYVPSLVANGGDYETRKDPKGFPLGWG